MSNDERSPQAIHDDWVAEFEVPLGEGRIRLRVAQGPEGAEQLRALFDVAGPDFDITVLTVFTRWDLKRFAYGALGVLDRGEGIAALESDDGDVGLRIWCKEGGWGVTFGVDLVDAAGFATFRLDASVTQIAELADQALILNAVFPVDASE